MSTAGDMAAIAWVCAAVVTFVVLLGRARVDMVGYELIAPTAEFSCDGLCRSLAYLPLALMLVGSAAGAAALFAWIHHGTTRRKEVLLWFAASAMFAPVFFWPAALEREAWLRASGLVAYFIAPVCAFVFGPVWVGGQFMVAIEQVNGTVQDGKVRVVMLVSGCASVSLFIVWALGVSRARSDNADLLLSGELLQEGGLVCGAACQYLRWVPLTELAIGSIGLLVALVCVSRGHGSERGGCFSICMASLCMSSGPTLLWSFESSIDSPASANWLMAFVIAPLISGVGLPCSVALCFMTVVQTAYSRDFYGVLAHWHPRGERFFLCCVAVTTLLSLTAYISCVAVLRANSASVHASDDHTMYSYSCTWPCVSLRVVSSAAAGSAAITLWRLAQSRFARWLAEHPAPDRTQGDGEGERFVGQRVEALYPNGRFYAATIAEVHDDGAAFTLNWDDGDGTHRRQPAANLRNIGGRDREFARLHSRARKIGWCGMVLASLLSAGVFSPPNAVSNTFSLSLSLTLSLSLRVTYRFGEQVLVLAVAEEWLSWPLAMPLEALIAMNSSAWWAYALFPLGFGLGFGGRYEWARLLLPTPLLLPRHLATHLTTSTVMRYRDCNKCVIRRSSWVALMRTASPRSQMLAEVYDALFIIVALSVRRTFPSLGRFLLEN